MRFLIPNFRTADSFVDNVASTIEQMGFEVDTMPRIKQAFHESKLWQLYRIIQEKRQGTKFWEQEKWLELQLKKKTYDVMLCLTQSIDERLLFLAQEKGIKTVAWWGDTPGNMLGRGLLCEGWNQIYIKDKHAAEKMKGLGLPASLLHEAMNPLWHKPLYNQIEDYMVIAGSFYDYRNYMTNALLEKNIPLKLFGRGVSKWNYESIKKKHSYKMIVKEEKSKYFGQGMACINSTAMSEFNSLNCRAFEIAGCKGLQFMEYRPAIEDCFEIDKEIKVFHSLEELVDLYHWAKECPKEALDVREAGYQRALKDHTYQKRMERIIADIN